MKNLLFTAMTAMSLVLIGLFTAQGKEGPEAKKEAKSKFGEEMLPILESPKAGDLIFGYFGPGCKEVGRRAIRFHARCAELQRAVVRSRRRYRIIDGGLVQLLCIAWLESSPDF